MTKKYLDQLTYNIIGACIEVHKALGPGLLENVYEECLKVEFRLRGINFTNQQKIPVHYKGLTMETLLRCDFLIENAILLEIKAIKALTPLNEAQLISYMKLLQKPKGILVNFHCVNLFKEGQKTYINEWFTNLPME
jgi:GxxExxY protein